MKFSKILVFFCAGLLWAGATLAEEKAGQWYLTPGAVGVWVADGLPRDDEGGFSISFGRALTDNINLEVMYTRVDHSGSGGAADQDVNEYELNFMRVWFREASWSPYFVIGLGAMDINSSDPSLSDNDNSGSIGMGLLIDLGSSVSLRPELRLRKFFAESGSTNDVIATIGFQIPFGSPHAEPPPPAPSDSDGDGVVDGADRCPGTPRGRVVKPNGCENDADGDGVVDGADMCPNTPAGAPVDGRGCPLDSDGDGVADYMDNCPGTPAGTRVDSRGCELAEEIHLRGVNFETNSAALTADSSTRLDDAVATLIKNNDLQVEVAGYTDSSGSAAYNENLSRRRAQSVMSYLVSHGVDAGMLSARGYGESNPIASNATNAGRAENRRVTLRILGE
jgi:OOP family OmpA-OmpF porin